MRGGNILMFGFILGGGYLALQWIRAANVAAKAAAEALETNPYNPNPSAPTTVSPGTDVTTAHPTVVGTALGFGYRYFGDPYAHE